MILSKAKIHELMSSLFTSKYYDNFVKPIVELAPDSLERITSKEQILEIEKQLTDISNKVFRRLLLHPGNDIKYKWGDTIYSKTKLRTSLAFDLQKDILQFLKEYVLLFIKLYDQPMAEMFAVNKIIDNIIKRTSVITLKTKSFISYFMDLMCINCKSTSACALTLSDINSNNKLEYTMEYANNLEYLFTTLDHVYQTYILTNKSLTSSQYTDTSYIESVTETAAHEDEAIKNILIFFILCMIRIEFYEYENRMSTIIKE